MQKPFALSRKIRSGGSYSRSRQALAKLSVRPNRRKALAPIQDRTSGRAMTVCVLWRWLWREGNRVPVVHEGLVGFRPREGRQDILISGPEELHHVGDRQGCFRFLPGSQIAARVPPGGLLMGQCHQVSRYTSCDCA